MATKAEGTLTNKRGQKLHTVHWVPESPKAVLIWLHGIGEYILRYDPVFPAFNDAGVAVFGFDAHGMGKSEPLDEKHRGFVNKFTDLVDDAEQFLEEVQKTVYSWPSKPPIFLGGGSLGGLVASWTALRKQDVLGGLVLQSAAIDVQWDLVLRIQAALGNVLASLVPYAKLVPAVRPEDMSQDPKWVEAFIADKELVQGNVRARTGNEVLKAFRGLSPRRSEFKLPIFAIHGTKDNCCPMKAVVDFLAHVSSTDKQLKEIEGGYHELFFGPDRAATQQAVIGWIISHTTGGGAAAGTGGGAAGGEGAGDTNGVAAAAAAAAAAMAAGTTSPTSGP